jgi:hypothetical protein
MTVPIYHNFVEAVRARSPTCIELTIGPDVISDKFTLSVLAQVGATTGDKIIVPIARDTARTTRILSPPPTAELASMWDTLALRLAILDPASLLIPGQGSIGTCPVIMKDGTCDELEYLYCSRLSH